MNKDEIVVTVSKWIPAVLKGDCKCPECGDTMIIIPSWGVLAYCVTCRKQFMAERSD